jgi:hypothetical protein
MAQSMCFHVWTRQGAAAMRTGSISRYPRGEHGVIVERELQFSDQTGVPSSRVALFRLSGMVM